MSDLVVDVQHLSYHYRHAAQPAVDRLTFTVRRGEIVGLLGPNGAGKTTTLHAILGLLQPTTGTVRVFGLSPLAERLQVMPRLNFASANVDLPSNLTALEVLQVFAMLYGVRRRRTRIETLLEQFELARLRRHLIGSLSSGEHMRLKLCKALLNEPELLILDEPTLSLDPHMAQQVRAMLKTIQRQRQLAVLHTSHNMHEVETFCDRICFLHQGRLVAHGTTQEVLTHFNSQTLDELFIRVATGGVLVHDERR